MGCVVAKCERDSEEQRRWNAVRRRHSATPAAFPRLLVLRGGSGKVPTALLASPIVP